jgi:hypothetical protein
VAGAGVVKLDRLVVEDEQHRLDERDAVQMVRPPYHEWAHHLHCVTSFVISVRQGVGCTDSVCPVCAQGFHVQMVCLSQAYNYTYSATDKWLEPDGRTSSLTVDAFASVDTPSLLPSCCNDWVFIAMRFRESCSDVCGLSVCCLGDMGRWQPASIHKRLPG